MCNKIIVIVRKILQYNKNVVIKYEKVMYILKASQIKSLHFDYAIYLSYFLDKVFFRFYPLGFVILNECAIIRGQNAKNGHTV